MASITQVIDAPRRVAARLIATRPALIVTIAALCGALLATYPVVFFNKSFLAPDVAVMLYRTNPSVPGYHNDARTWVPDGVDTGSFWQNLPYSFVQSSAVRAGEVPLWNRYSAAGRPLLGQGQSQLFGPLHWFTILSGGNAWGWDLKFVLALVVFSVGSGLLVLVTTRHVPAAIAIALSSPFLGYFQYRFTHPSYFSPVYAPWIILAWIGIVSARDNRKRLLLLAGLAALSVAQLGEGTPKEGVVTFVIAQLCGFVYLAFANVPARRKLGLLIGLAFAGAVTLCIAAPQWLIFLDTLHQSITFSDAPHVDFAPPIQVVSFFFGMFVSHFGALRGPPYGVPMFNPFVLLMAGWALFEIRSLARDRIFLPFALVSALSIGFAFGLVPTSLVLNTPYLNNIGHVGVCFGCAALAPTFVVAGFGVKALWQRFEVSAWKPSFAAVSIALLLIVIALTVIPADWQHLDLRVWAVLGFLLLATVALPYVMWRAIRFRIWRPAALVATIFLVIHLPMGLQLAMPVGGWLFFQPGTRPDYRIASPAVDYVRSRTDQPYRSAGVDLVLMAGTQSIYGLEGFNGADALYSSHYEQLVDALGIFRMWGWLYFVRPEDAARVGPALDLLGVKFLLADGPGSTSPPPDAAVTRLADLAVFERPRPWPRAFFTNDVRVYEQVSDVARMAYAEPGKPFAAVHRADASALTGAPGSTMRAGQDYQLSANATRFSVKTDGPGMIVLMEAFWPGHEQVIVNGSRVVPIRVNHAFTGIPVKAAGNYDVIVRYEPRLWPLSRKLFFAGLLGWAALLGAGALPLRSRGRSAKV